MVKIVFKLRAYQQYLVDQTRNEITNGAKGVLIQSVPGSGKSVIIAEIARLTIEKDGHVLFIVHRKELIEQITETFVQHEVNMDKVTINTVIKTRNRLGTFPKPTIIITDETHHSRAKTYREIYDFFPQSFRVGLTGTPWRMSGKGFTDIYDEMVSGKDVHWLIENDFLAPFDYYAPTLADLGALKKTTYGDYTSASIDEALKGEIFGNVVHHYKQLAHDKKTILYAHSVVASKHFAEAFQEEGIEAVHVDATTPKKERDRIMGEFRTGNIKVLCNVDLVSEGFDVPDCHCVILARPTASLVLHMQQSMRAMRYQPGKKATIIDHVANYTKHGLPDTPHVWTIEGVDRKNRLDDNLSYKTCPECFAAILSSESLCSICGHEFSIDKGDPGLNEVDGELQKIDSLSFKVSYEALRIKEKYGKMEQDQLKTLEDFYLFAKVKNIKINWIKYNFAEVSHLNWPRFHQKIKPLKNKYKGVL